MDTLKGYTAEQWMFAFLDMLDGSSSWWDIRSNTGLSEERCKELSKMFSDATKNGWPNRERPVTKP
jgi:hypothetical protein